MKKLLLLVLPVLLLASCGKAEENTEATTDNTEVSVETETKAEDTNTKDESDNGETDAESVFDSEEETK